jgi:hypothetical protein
VQHKEKRKLSSDGGDSGSKNAKGRNLASVALKTFSNLTQLVNNFINVLSMQFAKIILPASY